MTSNHKQLDNLFSCWRMEHSREDSASCEKTFPMKNRNIPREEFRNNWTDDGYLNDSGKCKILFILKESNIEDNPNYITAQPLFWLKENRTKYRKAIPRRLKKLTQKLLGIDDGSQWYEYAGMMNINKRGGFGKCEFEQLIGYAEKYKCFINKQISLMNPDIIVLLGMEFREKFKELSKIISFSGRDVYIHCHPAYKGTKNSFKDNDFLEPVEEIPQSCISDKIS